MPAAKVFVDTNVVLYFHDRNAGERAGQVLQWIYALTESRAACLNMQVLNELTYVLLRKRWLPSVEETFYAVDQFAAWGSYPTTSETAATARRLHIRYHYSWWDCLLLASAMELGCTHFLSEDLQDGQRIGTLTIIDPFAHSPQQVLT